MAESKENFLDQKNQSNLVEKETGLVDLEERKEPKAPQEVETWLRKIEKDPTVNQNSKKPGDDDSVLKSIATTVSQVTLPSDRKSFKSGFNKKITEAGRWLSEFILRIIKREKGNVKFKEK